RGIPTPMVHLLGALEGCGRWVKDPRLLGAEKTVKAQRAPRDQKPTISEKGVAAAEQVGDPRSRSTVCDSQAGTIEQSSMVKQRIGELTRIVLIAAEIDNLPVREKGGMNRDDLGVCVLGCGGRTFRNDEAAHS